MKFCKNCRFHLPPTFQVEKLEINGNFTRCANAPDQSVYLVTGDHADLRYGYATTMRMNGSPCGPDALLFELAPEPDFEFDPTTLPLDLQGDTQ